MNAFDLAIDKVMTDIKMCQEDGNLPWGLQEEHLEDADLTPYSIAFLTKKHRHFDRGAPVGLGNFDTLMLVLCRQLFFRFLIATFVFGVTTFGNILTYTDGSVAVTMKVTPYHRSFGPLTELIGTKVASMDVSDLAPIFARCRSSHGSSLPP
ncbi:hypothetical protein IHQ71_30390 (plasmid) [Rhizobium sp. TH2]|uniref:hypothetical protein n=1 Tax=Rhizobium sp. TH2 TaxID=2775403 RepID=UPI0021577A69|nr:hypothetical protein [Rhizobium sp. TH2]UVC12542.1 hypothetical protein IHQ71_30390 [Rhizobium sp. TH2]